MTVQLDESADASTVRRAGPSAAAIKALGRRFDALTWMAAAVVAIWILLALLAPVLAPEGPLRQSFASKAGPSALHWFGTDVNGRDILTRVLYGARITLPSALVVVLISLLLGAAAGALAGYVGGLVDSVVMRLVDLTFAFPGVILAMAVTAALGPDLRNAILALVIVSWPIYARVVRGLVLGLRNRNDVRSHRLLGASALRAVAVDIMPNVAGPAVVLATLQLGNAILLLSALSFLGLGVRPPNPEWGAMVAAGAEDFRSWWIGTFPGLAIVTVVLSLNLLGDRFRDVLDPRTAGKLS